MTKLLLLVQLFGRIIYLCESARILGIVPTPSYSHQIVFRPIWRELATRGHQLTVLTTNPINDPTLTNLKEIDLSFTYHLWNKKHNITNLIDVAQRDLVKYIYKYILMTDDILDQELQHPEVRRIIENEKEHFDLVMIEYPYLALMAFAIRFNCPFIGMTALDAPASVYDTVGNPTHPVLNPEFPLPLGSFLSFKERLISVVFQSYVRFYVSSFAYPKYDLKVRTHFGENYPPLIEVAKNVSLLFVNVDPIFHNIRPIVPAVIQIGGGTHLQPQKLLPKDLQQFLDNATEGCIYFSLGSNVKSINLQEDVRNIIFETFAELPYKVLWKFDSDKPSKISPNILLSNWFPQQDVLRHPNVKLFITQGGLQSLQEAVYNYIPILGMPFFGDQHTNIAVVVVKGFGLSVDHNTLTKKHFKQTILEVIENSKYRNKVKELADLALDQPTTGLQRAVWWAEYVIRHKGARHLRSPAIDLPIYQFYLIDIFGFLIFFCLFVFTAYYLFFIYCFKVIRHVKYSGKKKKE